MSFKLSSRKHLWFKDLQVFKKNKNQFIVDDGLLYDEISTLFVQIVTKIVGVKWTDETFLLSSLSKHRHANHVNAVYVHNATKFLIYSTLVCNGNSSISLHNVIIMIKRPKCMYGVHECCEM